MIDRIIIWLIKKLVFLWDRHGDKMVLSFGRDEQTDYSVLVDRYYDNYWTSGTSTLPYNLQKEVE